jgi:type IV pilus assembly protein PilB
MKKSEKKLGEILLKRGIINAEQLEGALAEQKLTKEFIGSIVVKRHYIAESDLVRALAEQFNLPMISLGNSYIDWDASKQFSPSLVLDHKCLPIKKDGKSITIAIVNPLDVWAIKRAEDEARGLDTNFVLVSMTDMEEISKRYKQFMRGIILDKLE